MNQETIAGLRDWAKSHMTAIAVACVLAVGLGLYLLTQHTAHVVVALPYALILLCPLMHFFMPSMHGGHSGHGGQGDYSGHMGQTGHVGHVGHMRQIEGPESRVGHDDPAPSRQERD